MVAYAFEADYGPYAQRLRTARGDWGPMNDDSGRVEDRAWATARCPGHTARALFFVETAEYADPKASFLTASLRAFAERAVKRRGCADLRLPR